MLTLLLILVLVLLILMYLKQFPKVRSLLDKIDRRKTVENMNKVNQSVKKGWSMVKKEAVKVRNSIKEVEDKTLSANTPSSNHEIVVDSKKKDFSELDLSIMNMKRSLDEVCSNFMEVEKQFSMKRKDWEVVEKDLERERRWSRSKTVVIAVLLALTVVLTLSIKGIITI